MLQRAYYAALVKQIDDAVGNILQALSETGALDKLYYRGPLRALTARTCRRNVSRVASDHLPVMAELTASA